MPETTRQPLQIDDLEARLGELREQYRAAEPYPHIVLDDVLEPGALATVLDELDAIPDRVWTNYLHLNERKYANTDRSTWGPTTQAVADAFSSDRFVRFLEGLTGFEGLHADDALDGGGLHRSLPGGFLNIHSDFTAHHSKPRWRRRVNLLLYLNREWRPEWGGELQLWDADVQRCVTQVEPRANRVLLFTTDEHSFHGHPEPLRFPAGTARQSLALYYFTEEESVVARSTNYRARPGDGLRGALIWLDKKALATYDIAKRRLGLSDSAVSRALGRLSRRRSRDS